MINYLILLSRYKISQNEVFENFVFNEFSSNLNFFLDNFEKVITKIKTPEDKTILYHILTISDFSERSSKTSREHPENKEFKKNFDKLIYPDFYRFASSLMYNTLIKDEELFLKVFDYFLPEYHIALKTKLNSSIADEIIQEPSLIKKINLCSKVQQGLFLPYQKNIFENWSIAYPIKKEKEWLVSTMEIADEVLIKNKKLKL
jgi:hypothetical protein